jgi:deazaflavin-dependent oxidoreductase (nitroreductase family)
VRRLVYDPLVRQVILPTGWGGFGTDALRVLVVRGRRTGRLYHHPIGVCAADDGERYVVSFYGDSEWARNVRAGMPVELHARRAVEHVDLAELSGKDKEEFLRFLVRRYPLIAQVWFRVRPRRLSDADVAVLVARYPVFRVRRRVEADPRPDGAG